MSDKCSKEGLSGHKRDWQTIAQCGMDGNVEPVVRAKQPLETIISDSQCRTPAERGPVMSLGLAGHGGVTIHQQDPLLCLLPLRMNTSHSNWWMLTRHAAL